MLHEERSPAGEMQEILQRIAEPDAEMEAALDHLRLHFYGPWKAVREYQERPERLEAWRAAEKPSQAWRMGLYFAQALRLLRTSLYG